MNHIYIGISLSFLCILLAYIFLSKLILVTVFCAILVVLYFKDDFTVFRYLASHVAYLYLWICELCNNIQIMYHQSNSANFPVRKCIENNGTVANKFERLHHRLKSNVHNLNSSYSLSSQPLSSSTWNSTANIPSHSNKSYQSIQEISKLSINPVYSRDGGFSPIRSVDISSRSQPTSPSLRSQNLSAMESSVTVPSSRSKPRTNQISQDDSQMRLDAKLFANVSSPGFCSRVAEELAEAATHQAKYDTAGAFPVVHFKSQSPKIKIKTPVRVRLAPPPSNDILYSSIASSSIQRSPVVGTDESMKSVLQVLKEISRKRIHSHVEDDCDETSKRLRISESQYNPESMLQTSLLQQTIQGKRAREESSPNEEDVKKRRKPSSNNEYLSSLSSSMSIKAPHLETKKRKAQAVEDSLALTPVLGKLLKVQTEVTPPLPSPPPALPPREQTPPRPPHTEPKPPKIPSPMVAVEQTKRAEPSPIMKPAEPKLSQPEPSEPSKASRDESTVSRLLGRMSGKSVPTPRLDIPAPVHEMFMTTNDLSLSPPKENRLAAMIAVLGGPSELNERENTTPAENKVIGKALFMTPDTPETPKQNKKVTFNDSLTTTKIYDRDQSGIGGSSSNASLLTPTTSKPVGSALFNINKSPVSSTMDTKIGFNTVSPIQSNSSSNLKEESKSLSVASPTVSASGFQQISSPSVTMNSSTPSITSPFATKPVTTSETSSQSTQPTFSFGNSTLKQPLPSENTDAAKTFSLTNSNLTQLGSSAPTFSPIQANNNEKSETLKASGFNLFTNKGNSTDSLKVENEAKPLVNGFDSSTSQFALNSSTPQNLTNKPSMPAFDVNTSKPSFNFTPSSNMFSKGSTSSTSVASSMTQATPNLTSTTLPETKPASSLVPGNQTTQPAGGVFGKSASFNFGAPSQSQPSPFGNPSGENTSTSAKNSIFGNSSQQSPAFGITTTPSASNNTAPSVTQTNSLFSGATTNNPKPMSFTGNGNSSTPQSNPVFGLSNTPASTNSLFTVSSSNSNTPQTGAFGTQTNASSAPSIFGNVTTVSESKPGLFSTFSATTQQSSPFNSSSSSNQASKPIFSSLSNTTPKFGESNSTTPAFGATTTANSLFSTQNTASPAFGSQNTAAPVFGSQSTATPAFGSQNNATPTFGSQNNTTPFASQNNATPTFGSQTSSTPAFGSQSNATPNFGTQNAVTPAFGNQNNATPTFGSQNTSTSAFGSQNSTTPSFGSQNTSTSAFGSQNSTTPSFGSQNNATNSFGSQNTAPPPFGSQNTAPPAFGTQTSAPPAFGSQTSAPPAFGSQTNAPPAFGSQTTAPPAFGSQNLSGNFSLGGSSTGAETKSALTTSSSPFMFGGSAASNQPTKPVGAAAPFSFSSSQPTPTQASSTQPSIPAFSAPSPAFGGNLQPPSFAASVQQPSAAPVFAFGQSSAAPSPGGFQFNATAPQPVQGGMFNIGSGSTAPRSKTGALRRRPK